MGTKSNRLHSAGPDASASGLSPLLGLAAAAMLLVLMPGRSAEADDDSGGPAAGAAEQSPAATVTHAGSRISPGFDSPALPESRAVDLPGFDAVAVLSEQELTEQRAMAKIEVERVTINDTEQNGEVSGNSAAGNTTGHNNVADHAFAGANGVVLSVQNTGNNVLIQNATTINVSVEQ